MTRVQRWLAAAAACACQAGASEEAPVRVRVIEGRTAVYASTNATREAVGWLAAGTELAVRGALPDEAVWVLVEPPEGVSVWVYRELVRDGAVTADKSRIRSGAGLNFRAVASLNKGDRVEVRGTYGDWLRIRPPAGLDVWVLRDRVEPLAELPEGGAPEEPPAPATNLPPAEVAGAATNAPPAVSRPWPPPPIAVPAALAGAALAGAADQGARVALKGVLDYGTVGGFAAPFCLVVTQADGETRPICHLLALRENANPHVGATVIVDGTRWILKGVALPVVVADELRPAE